MRAALAMGRRTMGQTAPNPAVGALVVRNGIVVGRGATAPGGRPHAEPIALAEAADAARGATLYVTLEPCSHHGQTPPCVDAIVTAGISWVVVALSDPDPRVSGRGLARLRSAGIVVRHGIVAEEAFRDHIGHIRRVTAGRPAVTLKMAETADGCAAGPAGGPRLLITGPLANAQVHMQRALHDAVLVGRGTATTDDPLLTVRLPGMENRPLRIVLDSRASLDPTSRLARTASDHPTLVVAAVDAPYARTDALEALGIAVERVERAEGRLDLAAVMAALGRRGLTRLFCEGGPLLASQLLLGGLADRVLLFTGPVRAGEGGLPTFVPDARRRLLDEAFYRLAGDHPVGEDRLRVFEKVEMPCSPGL